MLSVIAKLVTGPLVGALLGAFKTWQKTKMTDIELRRHLEETVLGVFSEVADKQADIIRAEMRGENWLQRNWRPMVAVALAFIIFFYGVISPVMVGWFGWPPVRVGDILLLEIIKMVTICLGGYIGGRSLEKIISMFRK